jgi:enhancer of yellow 2 transcription factor
LIRSKGLEKINLDDLVEEMLPRGRALVPTQVKEDLLGRIRGISRRTRTIRGSPAIELL